MTEQTYDYIINHPEYPGSPTVNFEQSLSDRFDEDLLREARANYARSQMKLIAKFFARVYSSEGMNTSGKRQMYEYNLLAYEGMMNNLKVTGMWDDNMWYSVLMEITGAQPQGGGGIVNGGAGGIRRKSRRKKKRRKKKTKRKIKRNTRKNE